MKKILCIFLGVFLLAVSFGCGGKSDMKLIESESDYVRSTRGTPEEVATLSFDIIGGADVMPIGGFYGPFTASSSVNGQKLPDYVSDEYFAMIKEVGINLIVSAPENFSVNPDSVTKAMKLGEKYNIGYFVSDTYATNVIRNGQAFDAETFAALVEQYDCSEAFVGIVATDEPTANMFGGMKTIFDAFYGLELEGKHAYCNLFPTYGTPIDYSGEQLRMTYEEYLTQYYEAAHPKFMSYDHYPYETENFAQYFNNLSIMRSFTMERNIPFWSFIQAGGQHNDAALPIESEPYRPSEGQMLWDINMNLAYGAKGIQYFTLIQPQHFAFAPNDEYDCYRNGLIGALGNRNEWFFYAKKANEQIRAIDSVLMNAKSMGVIVSGEEAEQLVGQREECFKDKKFRELTGVSGDALVGCFDYEGGTALYVVNFDKEEKGQVTLEFSDCYGYDVVQRAQTVGVCGNSLTLTLEAGEGALVVLR